MYKLEIIAEAKTELRKELAYSRKRWGNVHSRIYAKELRDRIDGLRTQPLKYQLRPDILPGIRILSYRGNRVIYTIAESRKLVAILAVLGNAQNIEASAIEQRTQTL